MTTSTMPAAPRESDACTTTAIDRDRDMAQLGEAIAELSARIHAASYQLLVLLRQFDEGAGWGTGFQSCAHWLHWRTGIDLGAAREKVRVARAVVILPVIGGAMERGELSYAKVRALTRIATPENERQLLDVALAGTAAHVERIVRAWRRVDRIEAAQMTERRHHARCVTTWVDEDGMVVLRGRLTPEIGAIVQRALDATADQLFRESVGTPDGGRVVDEVTPGQRRADALARLAEVSLADLDRGTAGDRYQVVVHVDRAVLHSAATATGADVGHSVMELDHAPACVSAETSRRIACDTSVVVMQHDSQGTVLDVGRKMRTIPTAIRRALAARDRGCQFPGCTARRCDGHHITHWADGGPTRLDNLILLCRRHHRAVHEEGFRVVRTGDGIAIFFRPDGTRLEVAPRFQSGTDRDPWLRPSIDGVNATVLRSTVSQCWDGEPLDLVWAVDVLRGHGEQRTERDDRKV
jgi:Domain of unknown function (DUF222)/HNH endonuclease